MNSFLIFYYSSSIGLILLFQLVQCQYFDQNMDDQDYLNLTHKKVKAEVMKSRQELEEQSEIVRIATKAYIGAKIKENLFKALRTLAEKELETMSMQNRPRQPRQDEDDDDTETSTENGLIPQLATIVQAIFGKNVNVTKYVETASKFLPRPIGSQLIGVVSLLDPSQFTSTTAPRIVQGPITPSPVNATLVAGSQQYPISQLGSGQGSNSPSGTSNNTSTYVISGDRRRTQRPWAPIRGTVTGSQNRVVVAGGGNKNGDDDDDDGIRGDIDEDYDDLNYEEESRRLSRQMQGLNPLKVVEGLESLWNNFLPPSNETTTESTYVKAAAGTTESAAGFDDEYTTQASRVITAVKGVMVQANALRKGVPDLFQGAREAYKFLETISSFLNKWESKLQIANREEDDE